MQVSDLIYVSKGFYRFNPLCAGSSGAVLEAQKRAQDFLRFNPLCAGSSGAVP